MQIAVHVLAYNVNRFLRPMLENVGPWVDKIFIAYPSRPFGYIKSSRETKTNPTIVEEHLPEALLSKIEIIRGDWETDEDTRNACFDRAKAQGFDWLIVQDADEFYTESSWRNLRRILERSADREAFSTTWYQFWKSSEFVIEEQGPGLKGINSSFAIRCKPHLKFHLKRSLESQPPVIDEPCYHYGWAMSDAEMAEKVVTWSHSLEVDVKRWFLFKWQYWSFNSRHICPTYPWYWRRAIRFPYPQPDFAHQFALELDRPDLRPASVTLGEIAYDARVVAHESARRVKRLLSGQQARNR
jgi:hypothetical protein